MAINKNKSATAVPETVVYCGPAIRGIARQYTAFTGGLPQALEQLCAAHPILWELIVPVDRFAEMRRALQAEDSKETMLYNTITVNLRREGKIDNAV